MLACGGECGNGECTFRTNNPTELNRHCDPIKRETYNKRKREKVKCPHCQKRMNRSSLYTHNMRKHNIRPPKRHCCPPGFDKYEFAFVKRLVETSIKNDILAGRDGQVDSKQNIAIAVYKRWQGLSGTDENRGNCTGPCTIVLYPHSLFSLTLDRIDDSKPHFVNNTLDNVCFTIRGMNTHTSLGKGPDTCARLCAEMQRVIPEEDVIAALEREKKCMNIAVARSFGFDRSRHNTLYLSVLKAFNSDALCRKSFGTVNQVFKYCYQLYADGNARCNISRIFFSGHAYNRVKGNGRYLPHPFAPSVDAIEPAKGHVPGNIRIICKFLNATDTSKLDTKKEKRAQSQGAIPHAWTKELWNHYVGCAN